MNNGMSIIVKTVSRLIFPFMFLFGIYIVLHGHLTPGGGFPGGVIIGSAVIMLILAYGYEQAQDVVSALKAEVAESIGGLIIVGLGITGIIIGISFLEQVLPLGTVGNLFSAGNLPILNIGVGIKVAAGFIGIFYAMMGLKGDE